MKCENGVIFSRVVHFPFVLLDTYTSRVFLSLNCFLFERALLPLKMTNLFLFQCSCATKHYCKLQEAVKDRWSHECGFCSEDSTAYPILVSDCTHVLS